MLFWSPRKLCQLFWSSKWLCQTGLALFGWAVTVEKSCCGLWAVEKLKAVWLNKYKIYLLSLSLLKQLWKSFLFHQFRKAESQKPKTRSNQLSKMYYGKVAASEKTASKSSPFGWAFGFWGKKPKPKAQLIFVCLLWKKLWALVLTISVMVRLVLARIVMVTAPLTATLVLLQMCLSLLGMPHLRQP